MKALERSIEQSLDLVEKWIEEHAYRGYEPFDGLTSYLYPLTFKNRVARQLLQQMVRRFPINLRPILGIRPLDSTKGQGYAAWGYLKRYRSDNDTVYRDKAFRCLDWLDRNKSAFYAQHSWGNHFPYASRKGYAHKFESTIVWTGLIGQVFLEAYSLFGHPRHREIIESIADWIMALPREHTSNGSCLSYYMSRQNSVHNANMIGSAFLAGAARAIQSVDYQVIACQAMEYSCARQLKNGAWFYGEDPKHRWIDAFHTGYNLDALRRYQLLSGDTSYSDVLRRGYEFFRQSFFEPSGCIRYYHNRTKPIDIQCGSQAIDTLVLFSPDDPSAIQAAEKSAQWYIHNMQDKDGHFYFRYYARGVYNKAAMIHWGQATMYKSLAHLVFRNSRASD